MAQWRVLADLVVIIHTAYVAFVVLGFAAIVVGVAAGWRWVRNFYFRAAHLAAIALVLAEALTRVMCPLTTLEDALRRRAGQAGYPAGFIGYWLDRIIYYDWPLWVFTVLYAAFTAVVVAAFWFAPPELPWRRQSRGGGPVARLP
jgi:Protein of Unknown function (DUF2784)